MRCWVRILLETEFSSLLYGASLHRAFHDLNNVERNLKHEIIIIIPYLLYPRHTKYVGVYSFRLSVRSYVRTFVRTFVRLFVRSSFRHRVKVFALKFIRPHILKTLWWISFIFGMMVDIGLKFLSAPSPAKGWPWGQVHRLRIFVKKVSFLCLS